MTKTKPLLILSDTHCGHLMGLTPPKWQTEDYQRDFWRWYTGTLRELGPFQAVIINGDAVDGEGKKENLAHITTDVGKQIEMAVDVIKATKCDTVYMVYGTPYHTTGCMEYEDQVASRVGAKISASINIEYAGAHFNFRHHSGKTSIPHGQGTLIAKRLLWQYLAESLSGEGHSDYVIRSHVHEYCKVETQIGTAITTPALQIGDSIFGRKFESWYHVGLLYALPDNTGGVQVHKRLYAFKSKRRVYSV